MKTVLKLLAAAVVLILAALLFIFSGLYDVCREHSGLRPGRLDPAHDAVAFSAPRL